MDERKRLGQRVKHLRRLRGYTQEQLAEQIDINPKYLSSIERGLENPTLDLLCRLATGLHVHLYELFQFEPDAAQLRTTLRRLTADVRDEELRRAVRVLEVLIH
jgi:transcriptional regulator with XRE-family HTH domain